MRGGGAGASCSVGCDSRDVYGEHGRQLKYQVAVWQVRWTSSLRSFSLFLFGNQIDVKFLLSVRSPGEFSGAQLSSVPVRRLLNMSWRFMGQVVRQPRVHWPLLLPHSIKISAAGIEQTVKETDL